VATGLLLLITTLVYAFRFNHNWLANDDSFYLDVTVRLMQGQVPYRDIALLHTPGFFLFLWPFLALLGVSLLSGKIALTLIGFTSVLLTYRLAQRILPVYLSVLCALLMVGLGPLAFYTLSASWLAGVFVILALDSLIVWVQNNPIGSTRPMFCAGLWLSLAFSTKQPYGLFPGMATVLWLMLVFSRPAETETTAPENRSSWIAWLAGALGLLMMGLLIVLFKPVAGKLNFLIYFLLPMLSVGWIVFRAVCSRLFQSSAFPKALGWLMLGGLCGLIPITLYQGVVSGWPGILEMYRAISVGAAGSMQRFYYPVQMRLYWPAAIPEILMLASLVVAWFRPRTGLLLMLGACFLIVSQSSNLITMQMSIYWIRIVGLALLAAVSVLMLRQDSRTWPLAVLPLALMTLFSIFLMLTVYPYPDPVYLIYGIVPFLLGLALVWPLLTQRILAIQPAAARWIKWLGALMLMLIFSVQAWVFLLHPGLLSRSANRYLDTPRGGIYIDEQSMNLIMPAVQFLEFQQNHGKPVNKILVLPDGPQLYFLSGHPNPTPYYDLQQPLTPEMEKYYLDLLGSPEMDYVFLTDYHLNYRNFQMPATITQYLNEHYWMQGMAGAYYIFEHRK
jgi:hypothetical protein